MYDRGEAGKARRIRQKKRVKRSEGCRGLRVVLYKGDRAEGEKNMAKEAPKLKNLLRQVSLFQGLDDADLDAVLPLLRERTVEKGEEVVGVEDPGRSLFLVEKGRLKVVLVGSGGREVILSILSEGDFFGEMSLLDGKPRSATVIALQESHLYALRRNDFQHYLEEKPQTLFNVLQVLCERLRHADSIIGNLALLDVYGRVARFLLDLAEREGEETDEGLLIKKSPSQAEIASMIGASRETINRALSDFVRRGMLQKQGRKLLVTPKFQADFEGEGWR